MKKFLPYILISIALIGLFSSGSKAHAQAQLPVCVFDGVLDTIANNGPVGTSCTLRACTNADVITGGLVGVQCTLGQNQGGAINQTTITQKNNSEFVIQINKKVCGIGIVGEGTIEGCFVRGAFILFYQLPAFLLFICAYFFNILISVSLSSDFFNHEFVASAWAIVRDLSNIFFILILLYVAVKVILGLGGHEVKKTIAQVIIMALLINFSMFFTKIVIDTSNILALIFYNKLNVQTSTDGKIRPYENVAGEKDVAGGMVSAFDPTSKLNAAFFEKAKETWLNGQLVKKEDEVPAGTMFGLILIAGIVMGFAAYALFVSGFSFIGRLIELWILIIFSPFAFMSSSLPILSHIENLGWDSWLKRLLKVSFMAPIFMFFLYFIFLLIHSKIYATIVQPTPTGTVDAAAVIKVILGILMPTILILVLLLKATEFAKKGSGQLGEMAMKWGQAAGGLATGLALGAATGGVGMLARGTLGRGAANLAESNRMRNWAAKSSLGANALKFTSGVASSSFDLRKAPGVGTLGKGAGVNMDVAKSFGLKEGFAQNRAAAVKKQEEFANKMLDTSDKGKAELSAGGMSVSRAADIVDQMAEGGMQISASDRIRYQMELMGDGLKSAKISDAARYINANRRTTYADRKQGSMFMTNKIAANKVRKDAATLKEEGSLKHALEHIAHEVHESTPHAPAAHAAPAAAHEIPHEAPTHDAPAAAHPPAH
ncbi:hypothetical protein K8Q98_03285 [Candidatus Nomurabacteria bacterium]|nr:hypothetical protein [Candidatus Nomurabacteria bacterium]